MASPFQPPDPDAKPVSSAELGAEMPDDGPVLDTGPSEIEVERQDIPSDSERAAPPEAELPPD